MRNDMQIMYTVKYSLVYIQWVDIPTEPSHTKVEKLTIERKNAQCMTRLHEIR